MKKVVLLLFSVFLLSGCVKTETAVSVKKDNTATITVDYLFKNDAFASWKEDKETIEEDKKMFYGLGFKDIKETRKGNLYGYELTANFKNINDVKTKHLFPHLALMNEEGKWKDENNTVFEKNDDGYKLNDFIKKYDPNYSYDAKDGSLIITFVNEIKPDQKTINVEKTKEKVKAEKQYNKDRSFIFIVLVTLLLLTAFASGSFVKYALLPIVIGTIGMMAAYNGELNIIVRIMFGIFSILCFTVGITGIIHAIIRKKEK